MWRVKSENDGIILQHFNKIKASNFSAFTDLWGWVQTIGQGVDMFYSKFGWIHCDNQYTGSSIAIYTWGTLWVRFNLDNFDNLDNS